MLLSKAAALLRQNLVFVSLLNAEVCNRPFPSAQCAEAGTHLCWQGLSQDRTLGLLWAWESRGQLCILTETADGEHGLWVFSDSDFKKSVGLLTSFLFLRAPLLSTGAGLPGLP